jgi:hypothetical protein
MKSQLNRYFILIVAGSILVAISCWKMSDPQSPARFTGKFADRANLQLIAGVEHDGNDIPDRS